MPRTTHTYDLNDVAEQLDERLEDLADEVRATDDEDEAQQLVAKGSRLEHKLAGVQWAVQKYDDATVTLGSLTAGEFNHVRDKTDEVKKTLLNASDSSTDADGARQIAFVAAGVVEAPFIPDHVQQGLAGFDDRRQAVADLAPQFVTWLEDEIDDLSTPDVEAGNFARRLAAEPAESPNSN